MNNEIINIKVDDVNEKQIPDIIKSQFTKVSELNKEIKVATNKAYEAKQFAVENVGGKNKSKKDAIENLQDATLSLANAQIEAMKAQKKQFEYQQKLSEVTKFLFKLGLKNIAMNRIVVQEIKLQLENATEEEIDDLAREEMQDLLKKLVEQQDLDKKYSELEKRVAELYSLINEQNVVISELKDEVSKYQKC